MIGGSPFYSQGLERYLYAVMLDGAGRPEEAARWYGSFTSNSIFDFVFLAPSYAALARISERLGRRREAADAYARALQLLRDADPQVQSLVRELEQGLRRVTE